MGGEIVITTTSIMKGNISDSSWHEYCQRPILGVILNEMDIFLAG